MPARNDSGPSFFIPQESDAPTLSEQSNAATSWLELENLFEFSPDGILIMDTGGLICSTNIRAGKLFGYARDELVGMSVETLVPERFRDLHPSHRQHYNAHPH
jgi:PAS domain-containing protein